MIKGAKGTFEVKHLKKLISFLPTWHTETPTAIPRCDPTKLTLFFKTYYVCVDLPRIKSFAPRSFCKRSLSARSDLSIASLTALAFFNSARLSVGTVFWGCAALMECDP